MALFFLLVEIFIPVFAVYLIIKKQSLAIVYIPFFMFSYSMIENKLPGFIQYFLLVGLLGYFVFFNLPFFKQNIFSVLLFLYFLFLLKNIIVDFKVIRPYFINVSWVFLGAALIPYIFKRYQREIVFQEVSKVAFLVALIFCVNTFLSTLFKFNPTEMYGISSGIFFGSIAKVYFNIFPLVLFLLFREGLKEKKVWYLVVFFVTFFLILLTMRRSVMLLSVLSLILVAIELFDFRKIAQFLVYGIISATVVLIVILNTSFLPQLIERYEQRDLSNRDLESEGRIMEFGLIYKDLFVYYDYDPWFGYRLFDSIGNYGKNKLKGRSLHTDFANIIHSSGFLGLSLYLLMIFIVFYDVWRKTKSNSDLYQFFYVLIFFIVFFINGRYTNSSYMLMMFIVLNLPLSKSRKSISYQKVPMSNVKVGIGS
jgi:O-antigen ligase